MGLFSSSPTIDASVESVFMPPPEHDRYRAKLAQKIVARESAAIVEQTRGERLLVVAYGQVAMSDAAIVVTDRRAFTIRKGSIQKSLHFSEIAETRLGAMPNGTTLVGIESITSQQDFAPTDQRRFSHIIQAEVATPRIGNAICGHIDRAIGAS